MNFSHPIARTQLCICILFCFFAALNPAIAEPINPAQYQAQRLASFNTFDARQAVAVDKEHFYAIHNFRITQHDKTSGKPLLQWDGESDQNGRLIHLDSGVVWQGKLYAAHSNYPHWPMTSSVEIWEAKTLKHLNSHSFGIQLGSFTWLDRHKGHWWGGFGNYNKVQKNQSQVYGFTHNTQVVKMDDQFNILQKWVLPKAISHRIAPMSNSGGSWGADGYLYLTGHDHQEVYVMKLPRYGSELIWVATVFVEGMEGQGIAWDRSEKGIFWGILKKERKVLKFKMPTIQAQQLTAEQETLRVRDFNKN
ncbi:hypothetical protein [Gayadomonas joobiniege]|uniref:hypothetical protein n=1 Tax=Gayadomonas joobiniege TaxID=1234606 RepID=UPI0003699F9D|nr:hypothetical protein [Gayadomonas joobiniege]